MPLYLCSKWIFLILTVIRLLHLTKLQTTTQRRWKLQARRQLEVTACTEISTDANRFSSSVIRSGPNLFIKLKTNNTEKHFLIEQIFLPHFQHVLLSLFSEGAYILFFTTLHYLIGPQWLWPYLLGFWNVVWVYLSCFWAFPLHDIGFMPLHWVILVYC